MPNTADNTAATKTPRDNIHGRPPHSSGSRAGQVSNRKALSLEDCEAMRKQIALNLTQGRRQDKFTLPRTKRQVRNLFRYQMSTTPNFGLPIEASIEIDGKPVLPEDVTNINVTNHLETIARSVE
eukprot:CAMPEP_0116135384 /NCGR_PEP_ID=MMETSP0329-20121206/11160_1 /TAXON_ID=697910 /ORGANISM="Pseudo-nitzschia arenysensis, Strain B593" /LENGTH=124 /DNA_ID=CAMNT_0003630177 /DNA_START=21 /DNA_END=395 /DNA_ORIENTATION=+